MAKKQAVQLQVEVNNDEEWEALLGREGLVVVDVYSACWGPCVAMVGILRKIKMDIGGDWLHLAIALADGVTALKKFLGKSEPTWMFIAGGQMVNLMFGADAPRLTKLITNELNKETTVLQGQRERDVIPFDKLAPEEQIRFEATEKLRLAEEAEKEKIKLAEQEAAHERFLESLMQDLQDVSIVIYLPFTRDEEEEVWKPHGPLMELLEPQEVFVDKEFLVDIRSDLASQMFYAGKQVISDECNEELEKGPCMVKWLRVKRASPAQSVTEEEEEFKFEEETDEVVQKKEDVLEEQIPKPPETSFQEPQLDILEMVVTAIYGYPPPAIGDDQKIKPDSLYREFAKSEEIPGIWTPITWRGKAMMIEELFPDYAEQFVEPEAPPRPALAALVFTFEAFDDVAEAIKEFEDKIIEMGFVSQVGVYNLTLLAKSFEEYNNWKSKTNKEKLIMVINNSEPDPLLSLSQFMPVYISQNDEVGLKDYKFFFPPYDEGELVQRHPHFPYSEIVSEAKSMSDAVSMVTTTTYDPLAYKEQDDEDEDDIGTLASGLVAV